MRISSPPSFIIRALAKFRVSVASARYSVAHTVKDWCSASRLFRNVFVVALCLLGTSVAIAADDNLHDAVRDHDYSFNFTGTAGKTSPEANASGIAKRTLFLPPHATLLPDATASELQSKIVEPKESLASGRNHAGLTLPQVAPPLPSKRPTSVSRKHFAHSKSESDEKAAILSEDSIGLAITTEARNKVVAVASSAIDTALEAKAEPPKTRNNAARHNPQKPIDVSAKHTPAKSGDITAVPKPVIIQQQTTSTVILTSSHTTEDDIPTTSRGIDLGPGSSSAKPQIPVSDIIGSSTSSDVEADIAMSARNDEIANPAIARNAETAIKRGQSQLTALSSPADQLHQKVIGKIAVPLPEAKPDREKLKRRALAKQRTQRRRAAARRRAALARAKAKAGQNQSSPASLLPNWVSSALQIAN
ncbi:MAG: hypothetical protein AAF709_00850 [Pseudomonadota bacterium]